MTCFSHSWKHQLVSAFVVNLAKWSESSFFLSGMFRSSCLHQQIVHLSFVSEKELRLSWHQMGNLGDKEFQNKDKAGQMEYYAECVRLNF